MVQLGSVSSDARQGENGECGLAPALSMTGPWGDSWPVVGPGGSNSGRLPVSIPGRIGLQMLLAPQRRRNWSLARPSGTLALTL